MLLLSYSALGPIYYQSNQFEILNGLLVGHTTKVCQLVLYGGLESARVSSAENLPLL